MIESVGLGVKGKRVAVIGAGPGGIAAGVALHQAGFSVKVFERHPQLRPLGGAIILNATGIVILRSLGVQVDDIFAAGLPEFRRHDGRVRVNFDIDMALLKQAGVSGWQSGMMRSELYERLLAAAPADMVVPNHSFSHYQEHADGVTLRQAMHTAGLPGTLEAIGALRRDPAHYLGFVEVHIEQGPVLNEMDLPLGIVTSINGNARFLGELVGMASHAGTTPMDRRRDAATACAELALFLEQRAAAVPHR